MFKKLYDAIEELNEKGTLQEQAEELFCEEKMYKELKYKYQDMLKEYDVINDEKTHNFIEYKIEEYEIKLENVKNEMCYLNSRIIDNFKVIEEYVEFEDFVELFGLKDDEIDREESFYDNLLVSSTKIGHVCRVGLIQSEKLVKEMIMEEDAD